MDFISAIWQVIMIFFGIYEENLVTREQCEQMWAAGAIPYPLSDEEYERAQKCKELQQD